MKQLAALLGFVAMAASAGGCATTRAETQEPRPPLEVPPVPPRVVEAVLPPAPQQIEPVDDLPPQAPPPSRRNTPRDTASRETKPEAKPPETAAVETPAAGPPAPPPTVPPLRTGRTGDGAQAERQIRDVIGRANALLGRVDYQKLSNERRKAYDQAKQFIDGAENAIKEAKFEYARELADKAETLAKGLQG